MHYIVNNFHFETKTELTFEELESELENYGEEDHTGPLEIIVIGENGALYKIIRHPVTSCNYGNYIKVCI